MKQIDEIRFELTQQLEQTQSQITELSHKLADVQKAKEESNDKIEFDEYKKLHDELKKNLNENELAVLSIRSSLQKKIKKYQSLGYVIFMIYTAIAIGVFSYLQNKMSIGSISLYLIVAIIGIVACVIVVKTMQSPVKRQLLQTFSDPRIIEYDQKNKALLEDLREKNNKKRQYQQQLTQEERDLKQELSQAKETEATTRNQLEELDFNFKYKDTILFYGRDGANHYDIYIDGLLYDTVKGKQLTQILLTPGLHSFKLTNTRYNFADDSVDYSFTFNTIQIMAGETPSAYAIVCEFKTMQQVTGKEFQKITKTNLM